MRTAAVLEEVRGHGGSVKLVSPTRLHVEAPAPLPPELIEALRANKPAIIAELQQAQSGEGDPFLFEERAAKIEADNVAREWAEGFAQLCTMPRPAAYTQQRWDQILNDGGLFLDQWKKIVVALGWRPVDVFGVCPASPVWRYDQMGLVPLLEGRRVIAITADAARIDCGGGLHTTFYRRNEIKDARVLWKIGCLK